MTDPPSFTLVGDTTGGPPETSTWTRNGMTIIDDVSYSISLTVPGVDKSNKLVPRTFMQSRYRSTLTVTGNLPGVYVYSVINRAMSAPRTANFTIEGILKCMWGTHNIHNTAQWRIQGGQRGQLPPPFCTYLLYYSLKMVQVCFQQPPMYTIL